MDEFKTDTKTFNHRKTPRAIVPARTRADHAMDYAKDTFKRLTGYPAGDRIHRGAITGADGAKVYAEDIFARLRGNRPDHPYDYGYYLQDWPRLDDGYSPGGGAAPRTRAEWAMVYARDMFRRLRALPAEEPLHPERRPHTVRHQRHTLAGHYDDGSRDDGRRLRHPDDTAKTAPSHLRRFPSVAIAVRRGMMRLALLIRRSVLEPYARRRGRKTALAQLKALDDWLLADIGVRRNDIERIVDRLLAGRDERMVTLAAPSLPTEDRGDDRRMAA